MVVDLLHRLVLSAIAGCTLEGGGPVLIGSLLLPLLSDVRVERDMSPWHWRRTRSKLPTESAKHATDPRHLPTDHASLAVWPGDTPPPRESCSTWSAATASRCPRCTRRSTSGPTPTAPIISVRVRRGHRGAPAGGLPGALPGHPRQRPAPGPRSGPSDLGVAITEPTGAAGARTPFPIPNRFTKTSPRSRPSWSIILHDRGVRLDRHRHAQRRPVRLEGPAGPPPLPRPRHGHPRGPGARRCSGGPLRADRPAASPGRLRCQPGPGHPQDPRHDHRDLRRIRTSDRADGEDPLLAYRDQFPILAEHELPDQQLARCRPGRRCARACRSITRPGPRAASGPGRRPGGRWSPTSATSSPR